MLHASDIFPNILTSNVFRRRDNALAGEEPFDTDLAH